MPGIPAHPAAADEPWLDALLRRLRQEPSRLWSLLITFYGDAILPRGGSVALATLNQVFSQFGASEGALRTAVSRLAADEWLTRQRVSRNSFYRLADKGRSTFLTATQHIYDAPPTAWSGHFALAILAADTDREAARAALLRSDFGSPAPGVWLAPEGAAWPPQPGILRLRASADSETGLQLAASAWPLDRIAADYAHFIGAYGPILARLDSGLVLADLDSLVLRILLVHEYRRVVLRDPLLPAPLLPADWPGGEARRLCGSIYHAVLRGSERWLDRNGSSETGRLPAADATIFQRFR